MLLKKCHLKYITHRFSSGLIPKRSDQEKNSSSMLTLNQSNEHNSDTFLNCNKSKEENNNIKNICNKTYGSSLIFSRVEKNSLGCEIDIASLINEKSPTLYSCESLMNSSFEEYKGKCTNNLEFESRFESGNLNHVMKVRENEYKLILQKDTNSANTLCKQGITIGFFFNVSNATIDQNVIFTILNIVII